MSTSSSTVSHVSALNHPTNYCYCIVDITCSRCILSIGASLNCIVVHQAYTQESGPHTGVMNHDHAGPDDEHRPNERLNVSKHVGQIVFKNQDI